jgi:hypothetical protein
VACEFNVQSRASQASVKCQSSVSQAPRRRHSHGSDSVNVRSNVSPFSVPSRLFRCISASIRRSLVRAWSPSERRELEIRPSSDPSRSGDPTTVILMTSSQSAVASWWTVDGSPLCSRLFWSTRPWAQAWPGRCPLAPRRRRGWCIRSSWAPTWRGVGETRNRRGSSATHARRPCSVVSSHIVSSRGSS